MCPHFIWLLQEIISLWLQSHIEEQAGEEGGHGRKSPPELEKKSEPKPDVVINMPIPEFHSVGVVLMHVPHVRPLCFYLAQSYSLFAH